MNELQELIGKTIIKVEIIGALGYDDTVALKLYFSDKTEMFIRPYYTGYTGESIDEYPTGICAEKELDDDEYIKYFVIKQYNIK